jgi:colanic acid/amylovoran biosynthesis glycosyltransferase
VIDAPATHVVHSVYRWGVVTEDWIRMQVAPAPGVDVSVLASRRAGEAGVGDDVPVRAIGDDGPGRFAGVLDRGVARLTGRRWVWPYVRRLPPGRTDVVHAHFGDWAWSVAPIARRLDARLIASFYGYDAGSLPRRPGWSERLRELFAEAAAIVVEAPAMAERVVALGCPRTRIQVIPLGVDIPAETYRRARPGAGYRILVASSLREKKGVDDSLRAVAAAVDLPEGWSLEIVGDGPLRSPLHRLAELLGIADGVVWSGYLPGDRLQERLSAADVLLQSSRTAADGDTEGGAPVILLHASAAGLPIVSTRHADIPFVVEDEQTGLLAPERDVAGLAERLVRLADPDLRSAMGAAGRRRVGERFTVAGTRTRLAELYRAVGAREAGGRA